MGWFSSLLYKKKTFQEIKEWTAEEERKQNEERKKIVETLEQEFPQLLQKARDAVNALIQAELLNPNIPERAKHYMKGNRAHTVKLTTRLIDDLKIPKTQEDFKTLSQQFQQYAQNTVRSAAILSEFFGQEVKAIRNELAEIEKRIHDTNQGTDIAEIQSQIVKIENIVQENDAKEKQKKELNSQISELKQKQENLQKQKEQHLSSQEYSKIKEELVAASKERQQAEQAIADLFRPLTSAFKKYAHLIHDKTMESYAENPLQALVNDYELRILKHTPEIKEKLAEFKLEKEEKAKESIQLMTKTHLSALIHAYANAKKKETSLQREITTRPIIQELEKANAELKELSGQIENAEKELGKITFSSDEQERQKLNELLKKHKMLVA
ncbi:MAG TPA: hypothetical protein VI612_02815 [Candidatus Nanoarchaeia archaeon]|nr:hypothetical protein [Candidatus Nanoarchaeia archaeon]